MAIRFVVGSVVQQCYHCDDPATLTRCGIPVCREHYDLDRPEEPRVTVTVNGKPLSAFAVTPVTRDLPPRHYKNNAEGRERCYNDAIIATGHDLDRIAKMLGLEREYDFETRDVHLESDDELRERCLRDLKRLSTPLAKADYQTFVRELEHAISMSYGIPLRYLRGVPYSDLI